MLGTAYYFGPKAFLLYIINRNRSQESTPHIYLKPTFRDIRATFSSHSKSDHISTDYVRLKAPWSLKQQSIGDISSTFLFHEKKLITITNVFKEESIIDGFLNGTPEKIKGLQELIGEGHLRSDFDFVLSSIEIL